MRFRQSSRTPYLNRRDQFRLALMVVTIGLIVAAIQVASRPESWYWLTGTPGAVRPGPSGGSEQPPAATAEPEFRPIVEDEPLPPEVVRVVRDVTPPDAGQFQPRPGDSPPREGTGPAGTADTVAAPPPALDARIAPELLTQIRDNSVGIRESERSLYYYLLARTRDLPPAKLEGSARKAVAFALLMTEAERFLGEILTVRGELRRLVPQPAGANEYGLTTLWEGWLFTPDSGRNPWCVRCTSIPDGMPTGEELPPGTVIEVTGYFFKRYGYPTQDDRLHVAPLILAKSFRWFRPRAMQPRDDHDLTSWVLALAGGLGSLIALLLWRFRVSDRRFERLHLRRLTAATPEALAALDNLPVTTVEETLRALSREAGKQEVSDEIPEAAPAAGAVSTTGTAGSSEAAAPDGTPRESAEPRSDSSCPD